MKTRQRLVIIVLIITIVLFIASMLVGANGGLPFDLEAFDFDGVRQSLFGDSAQISASDMEISCLDEETGALSFDGSCTLLNESAEEVPSPDNPRGLGIRVCEGAFEIVFENSEKGLQIDTALPMDDGGEQLDFNVFHEGDTEINLNCTSSPCTAVLNDAACPENQP